MPGRTNRRSTAERSAAGRSALAADIVLIDRHMSRYTYMVDSRRWRSGWPRAAACDTA